LPIGYNYFAEFAPKRTHAVMGTIWIVGDGVMFIGITLYYRFVSKNWEPVFVFALILNIIVLAVLVFILPESPKWLYNKRRFKEFN